MSRITTWWAGEGGRRYLWAPVLFAAGIAVYFAQPTEPAPLAPLYYLAIFLLGRAVFPGRSRVPRIPLFAIALIICGGAWAAFHTSQQNPVVISKPMNPRPISGTVADIERVEKGVRFTLKDPTISGFEAKDTPERIRISVRPKKGTAPELPHIGDHISIMAGLLPPMGPALPGGFDFARYFFFRHIGAVGFGLPPWKVEQSRESGFAQWRFALTEKIITQLGPERGPLAAGLITGEDRAITDADFSALRASNLYHIIAISGGHMVVIAGVVFLTLRWLLLCIPGLGQRPQMKSLAAGISLIIVTAYLFVTGMPVSAVRAYLIIALVLVSVLLRREVDTMRSLLLAALIMLLADPSDLLEPGFMLSFAATLAIIALVETAWFKRGPRAGGSLLGTLARIVFIMIMVSVVAEAATTPLVISMFNNVGVYGVLANTLATPIVTFLIMPAVAFFFVLLPFGLEHYALSALDYGVQLLMAIAYKVASFPHAQLFVPSLPSWGVASFAIGLLFLCLVRQRMRLVGIALMIFGVASIVTVKLPDILVGPQVKQIAIRTDDGYKLVRGRKGSLLPELWANGLGYAELPPLKPGTEAWRCDKAGCIATVRGHIVAFPNNAQAMNEDCDHAALVFTTLDTHCPSTLTVNSYDLNHGGVHAVWVDRMHVENSAMWQGRRPWSAYGFTPKASTLQWRHLPRASAIRQ